MTPDPDLCIALDNAPGDTVSFLSFFLSLYDRTVENAYTIDTPSSANFKSAEYGDWYIVHRNWEERKTHVCTITS